MVFIIAGKILHLNAFNGHFDSFINEINNQFGVIISELLEVGGFVVINPSHISNDCYMVNCPYIKSWGILYESKIVFTRQDS